MVHWVGRLSTTCILNVTNGKQRWGCRGLPEEAALTQRAPHVLKCGSERHIEDKVSQAAPWARALDRPRDIKVALHNKPRVSVRL